MLWLLFFKSDFNQSFHMSLPTMYFLIMTYNLFLTFPLTFESLIKLEFVYGVVWDLIILIPHGKSTDPAPFIENIMFSQLIYNANYIVNKYHNFCIHGFVSGLFIFLCYLIYLSLHQFPSGFLLFFMPTEKYPQVFLQENSDSLWFIFSLLINF